MTAENIFAIATHLPISELQRLYVMLDKKISIPVKRKKSKQKVFSDIEALEYLIRKLFSEK